MHTICGTTAPKFLTEGDMHAGLDLESHEHFHDCETMVRWSRSSSWCEQVKGIASRLCIQVTSYWLLEISHGKNIDTTETRKYHTLGFTFQRADC